jgi:hypothetical protein
MALLTFMGSYTVAHDVTNPEVVAIDQGDTMTIVLTDHPVTGAKLVDGLAITPLSSPHVDTWKNAANVAYDAVHDQITGTIVTLGPPDINNNPTYRERAFCMTLTGHPQVRANTLHCYVSESLSGGGTDPDDGSWAGDVN